MRKLARVYCALPLLMLCLGGTAWSQATLNIGPTISYSGIVEQRRAQTLCVATPAGTTLSFEAVSVADGDIDAGIAHARVELEPIGLGNPSVSIPGLAQLPDVEIIREEPDRIRFNAPLSSVNAAFAALTYQDAQPGDSLELIFDDLQLPALSTELVFHLTAAPASGATSIKPCLPPPDLLPESDTGASDSDDITAVSLLMFEVSQVQSGDIIQLFNDGKLISEAVADANSVIVVDPLPTVDVAGLYSVTVNNGLASAAWSVALVSDLLFNDGFEGLPVEP